MGLSIMIKNLFSPLGKKENLGYAANAQLNRTDSFKHQFVFSNNLNYLQIE